MRLHHFIFFCLLACYTSLYSQDMQDFNGHWEGNFEHSSVFNFIVEIGDLDSQDAFLKISNGQTIIKHSFSTGVDDLIEIKIDDKLSFNPT